MGDVIVYIACSVDGYIADEDGGVGWLDSFEGTGEDYGYTKFYASLGAVVMGAKTYEQVLDFGVWPYEGVETVVVTHRSLPQPQGGQVTFYAGDLSALVEKLKADSDKDIWLVGGAQLLASFMQAGLVHGFIISFIPALLGKGIPLFLPGGEPQSLKLTGSQTYESGIVQATYRLEAG